MGTEVFVTAIIFYAMYSTIKLISDHLLRRKLIKAGQFDKAGILEQPKQSDEVNKYPSLKWGLVALTSGIGLIIINYYTDVHSPENIPLQFGILLVSVSVGFLIYFILMNKRRKE